MELEVLLPANLKRKAIRSGNEWGWRKKDVDEVFQAAKELRLAALGGQVQFVFEDGTCELYWLDMDPAKGKETEEWSQFSERSIAESRSKFHRLCETTNFIEEGTKNFQFLSSKAKEPETDLASHLTFVVYLVDEAEWKQLKG
ncbi:MAG TPA: hypothetical protein VJ550_02115 [Geomonas sp.]|nr:hypothetical protein [Geomonas sp.]